MIYINLILTVLNKKICFTIGRAFLILLVLVCAAIFWKKCTNKPVTQVGTTLPVLQKPIIKVIDGVKVAQVEEKVYTKEDFKRATDSIRKKYKVTAVSHSATLVQTIDTVLKPVPFYIDTTNHTIFSKDSSKYITLTFTGDSRTNTGIFGVRILPDTVTLINTFKKHLFKANERTLNISHTNVLLTTEYASSASYREPKPIIVFGPYVGYDLLNNRLGIGVCATFNLLSLKLK